MAKAILLCGKLCSGKSRYAKKLLTEQNAVLLSCDELMLRIFPASLGESHDDITAKVKQYLFDKALDIIRAGESVILDFGFWTRKDRTETTDFFRGKNVQTEWHYIDISDENWRQNIQERNDAILSGGLSDYFIDDGLLEKHISLFEPPEKAEMDTWYINTRA